MDTAEKIGAAFDVFKLRDAMVRDYSEYLRSFLNIRDERIRAKVDEVFDSGLLWPEPLIQMNPNFEPGSSVDELVDQGVLHAQCRDIFVAKKETGQVKRRIRLHRHQQEAIKAAGARQHYVLTTGTGSGKSLSYIIPIVDYVLKAGSGKGVKALIIYPMNALANSQLNELERFLKYGFASTPVTFARYTGQEGDEERKRIQANPPDVILTNYVMMELILTRPHDHKLVEAASTLSFLVFDELHTYRGRQGADVAILARRIRERCGGKDLLCVGTSATLSSDGDSNFQRAQVARFASQIFGVEVSPKNVIGETLQPVTSLHAEVQELANAVQNLPRPPLPFKDFVSNPLSCWVENSLGMTVEESTGRLVRAQPLPLSGKNGAGERLAEDTGLPLETCVDALQQLFLLSYEAESHPQTGRQPFAFRLHQMMSKGDSIYASLEPPAVRHLTLMGQQFVPGHRDKTLLPMVFCRECGQEYYCVNKTNISGVEQFLPRSLWERADEGVEPGYLHFDPSKPWPDDPDEQAARVPEEWTEDRRGTKRVIPRRRAWLPQNCRVDGTGTVDSSGSLVSFIPAPFRFCLECGVTYNSRQRSDISKLAVLDTSGRSTATTLLTLSVLRGFATTDSLKKEAKKLLSFTDNRQDASLQAGHFNDFIQVGWLRSALYRAAVAAGPDGLRYDELTHKVFDALNLSLDLYAQNREARFQAREDIDRALRDVMGYWLYRDQRRGWRINFPNLEQCGLLRVEYASLDEASRAGDLWMDRHQSLADASPERRAEVLHTLLDLMRRELCIKVDYLEQSYQERILQGSSQRLISPWALDDQEPLERSQVLFPRPRLNREQDVYPLTARGGFGQYLRRKGVLNPERDHSLEETEEIIRDLLRIAEIAGLVQKVRDPVRDDDAFGYQLVAAGMRWIAGDGSQPSRDPIRQVTMSSYQPKTNEFFVRYYTTDAQKTLGYQGREHTAQVPNELRQEREEDFRGGELPVLFCSPTMELGVDIAELNVVNMRNVPPTPANYAQRSGRAGRSGQPALVFTYCTTGSPHDQYYFKRPQLMVAGSVGLPRLDLTNQELIQAHLRAIWLAATGVDLKHSLKDILDLSEESLPVAPSVRVQLDQPSPVIKARERAQAVLNTLGERLDEADWYTPEWLDATLAKSFEVFNRACDRWRDLYRAATQQMDIQHKISKDPSRSKSDRDQAHRLHREAKAQLEILLDDSSNQSGSRNNHSDFYSYRYFASEGFLPGYNFPRLPLSAYIPARRERHEYLQRPRFLAISEFGPRSVVYHEGARYLVNRVILSVEHEEALTSEAKICDQCGYLHPVDSEQDPDVCDACGAELKVALRSLFRMRHVSTKRRDRIHCDEEERFRLGYDLLTGVRFPRRGGRISKRVGSVQVDGKEVARLNYGQAATLWRMNLGWKRRRADSELGFVLDLERGYWAKDNSSQDDDPEDPMSKRLQRVVPYVEDHRNCIVLDLPSDISVVAALTLQWALKNAIQVLYQLESNELAAEPLPNSDTPRCILLYESAEGGAGVLRSLLDDSQALSQVASKALEICHFDPETGKDLFRAPGASEDCEAACYDCLLSYGNQKDHLLLDRHTILGLLRDWQNSVVSASPGPTSRNEHILELQKLCDSELEKTWLHVLEKSHLHLPHRAQVLVEEAHARPDFLYTEPRVAVFIDGPHHQFADVAERDTQATERLEDLGYEVLRFRGGASLTREGDYEEWSQLFEQHPHIFGRPVVQATPELNLDLFEPEWHELVRQLRKFDDWNVEPGEDLMSGSKVVGTLQVVLNQEEKNLFLLGEDKSSLAAAANEQGLTVQVVDPQASDAVNAIRKAWEEL